MFEALISSFSVSLTFFTLVYFYSLHKRDASVVDVAWGFGFILLAAYLYITNVEPTTTQALVLAMVLVWGVRLGLHIGNRNSRVGEDWRYAKWREDWGKSFWWRSYLQVFVLQSILLTIVALPIIASSVYRSDLQLISFLGLSVWAVGLFIESVADIQLREFKVKTKNKKQRFLKSGLWKYSRHPNYFGEATLWWGVWIVVMANSDALLTVIGPITITLLVRYISGVPMLERKYSGDGEFEKYKRTTSVFIPMPPKNQ